MLSLRCDLHPRLQPREKPGRKRRIIPGAMTFEDAKRIAIFLLKNYETAWKENAALRSMLRSVPMVDGTKGIPAWEQTLERHLSNEQVNEIARKRFAPIYDLIEHAQQDSGLVS